jgi:hypothetical protein
MLAAIDLPFDRAGKNARAPTRASSRRWHLRNNATLQLLGVVTLLAFAVSASAAGGVVPNAFTNVTGGGNNSFPFSCGSAAGVPSMRYQQVYLGSEVGSLTLRRIAFREKAFQPAFGPSTITGVSITLSSTSNGPGTLSTTFADNVGADAVTVFSGNLTLSGKATGSSVNPGRFPIVIPLQTPFLFNANSGKNLLLDVTVPTCISLGLNVSGFDSTGGFTKGAVSRAYAFSSGAATALQADDEGLITKFCSKKRKCK